jgi:hypothetical protein
VNFGSKSAFVALFSQIGITLLVANLAGALLGRWVDGALNCSPLFLITGFLGGFAVGAVGAAQLIKRSLKQFELSDKADREARLARRRAESEREEQR